MNKKILISVIVLIMLITGGLFWLNIKNQGEITIQPSEPVNEVNQEAENYYDLLEKKCAGDSCCLASLKTMKENNYKEADKDGNCPGGFQWDTLWCSGALKWCEPIKEITCRDENYKCTIEDISCCSGLKLVEQAEMGLDGFCKPLNCGSVCTPCGNGICDEKENKCNCPEDCEGEINTTDWQIYQNEEFGFEVKYPKEWYFYNMDNNFYFQQDKEVINGVPSPHANALNVEINKGPDSITLQEAIKTKHIEKGMENLKFEQEDVIIGGIKGVRVKSICDGMGCGVPEWFVINNSRVDPQIYYFNSNLGYSETFDQILSTFKFIEK